MIRIAGPMLVTVLLSMVVFTAATPALAGEVAEPMPKEATLYYACMSFAGHTEYDSAAFALKNPGPTYSEHAALNTRMTAAFDAYLTQKHGFHGIVQCSNHKTLAAAKEWLKWRESDVLGKGMNNKYVATDWTFAGGDTATASNATPAPAPANSTSPPTANATAPAASGQSTQYFVCIGMAQGVAYESDVFSASNDAGTARRMYFGYAAYLAEKYKVGAMARCTPRPTREAAQAFLAKEFPAGVQGGVKQHIATGWVYSATPATAAHPQ